MHNQQYLEASQLHYQGITQAKNQNLEAAVSLWQQALLIYREIDDCQGIGNVLGNLALADHFLGNYTQAIEYHQQNLDLEQAVSQHPRTELPLEEADVHDYLYGEYTDARQVGSPRSYGYAWFGLGFTYYWLNDYAKAIDAYNLSLNFTHQTNDRPNTVRVLAQLGEVYFYLADYEQSIKHHQQAVDQTEEIAQNSAENLSSKGNSLNALGNASIKLGDWFKAEKYYTLALPVLRESDELSGQGNAIAGLGIVHSNQGNHRQAIDFFEQSLPLFEQDGNRYNCGRAYNLLGQAYYFLGEYTQAVENHRRSLEISQALGEIFSEERARSELGLALFQNGLFAEAEEQLRLSIEILETIRRKLGSQDDFKVSIFDRHPEPYQLLQAALVAQSKHGAALETAERGRARAFVELLSQGFTSPEFSSATIDAPAIAQLQQIARDYQSTLVEYSLIQLRGLEQVTLLIWVINAAGEISFRSVDLDSLQQQHASLSTLVLQARDGLGVKQELLRDAVPRRFQHLDYTIEPLRQLYHYLIHPIAEWLPKNPNERVVFIPQGNLFLVPFAALQNPKTNQFLIEQHTILVAPSIQIFALVNQQLAVRSGADCWSALIVGNPDMPFIKPDNGQPPEKLTALPAAEIEAKTIATVLQSHALTGSVATKSHVVNQLPTAKIIHLSTHGLLDDVQQLGTPGAIALAPDGNDSGFLTARDILEQFTSPETRLSAELVVLSACSTGLGKITGDGVVGLSRCFMAAGVSSLVVSLWSVNDLSTTMLMIRFYQELKSSGNVASALRNSQCWLRSVTKEELRDWIESLPLESNQKRDLRINLLREIQPSTRPFQSPFYWAAFSALGKGAVSS